MPRACETGAAVSISSHITMAVHNNGQGQDSARILHICGATIDLIYYALGNSERRMRSGLRYMIRLVVFSP